MLKNELISEVAQRASDIIETKITKSVVEAILQAYSNCVLENLNEDKEEKIPLLNIGNFTARHVAEKSGISTLGEKKEWTVPEHDELAFKIKKSVKTLA